MSKKNNLFNYFKPIPTTSSNFSSNEPKPHSSYLSLTHSAEKDDDNQPIEQSKKVVKNENIDTELENSKKQAIKRKYTTEEESNNSASENNDENSEKSRVKPKKPLQLIGDFAHHPDKKFKYKKRKIGKRDWEFKRKWSDDYEWLHYNENENMVYCFLSV